MEKKSTIINVVVIIAVAVLYFLHFTSGKDADQVQQELPKEKETTKIVDSETSIESGAITSVGYINIDSLQSKYSLYDEMLNKLKGRQKRYEREFSTKMKAFEQKVQEFQKNAATMSQFEGQMKQQELAEEEQKLYKLREDFAVKFQQEEMKLNEEFEKTIKDYITKMNDESNYDIIIGASQMGNIILHHKPGVDITQNVVDGLNAEYDSQNAKQKEE